MDAVTAPGGPRDSLPRLIATLAILVVYVACSKSNNSPVSTSPDAGSAMPGSDSGSAFTDSGDGSTSVTGGDAGVDAGPPSCDTNPVTYLEIINACTNAIAIPINDEPPCLLPDGGLPSLDASIVPCLLDAGYTFPDAGSDAGHPDGGHAGDAGPHEDGGVDAGPPSGAGCMTTEPNCGSNNECCPGSICTTYTNICQNHCGTDLSRCQSDSDCCPNFTCDQSPPGPGLTGPYCTPTVSCVPLLASCSPRGAGCCSTAADAGAVCGPYSLTCVLPVGSPCSANNDCSSGTCGSTGCVCAPEGAACNLFNDCCATDSSGNRLTCIDQLCQPSD